MHLCLSLGLIKWERASFWLSALPCWCMDKEDEWVQLPKNVMILLHRAAMNERLSLHFLHIPMLFRQRPGLWLAMKLWSNHMITQSSAHRVGCSLWLSLSLICRIEQRTIVQSQFMLKSSTQIMFKQMQTKFVEKPLLHFPPNLIKTLKLI